MTAFRPDAEPTAQEELGGNVIDPKFYGDLPKGSLDIVSPRIAKQAEASKYYTEEFGLCDATGLTPDEKTVHARGAAACREALRGLRLAKSDLPKEEIERNRAEEWAEELARIRKSWGDDLEAAQQNGRLF